MDTRLWDNQAFLRLSPMAQRAYMFLVSQRDLAHTGVLPLRVRRWASKAAGLTESTVRENLAELASAGFVVVDADAEELWIYADIGNSASSPEFARAESPKPPSSTPAKQSPERGPRGAAAKRGTRIPDDFKVPPEMVAWARQKVPPGVDLRRETEKFVNYWRAKTGQGATKLDWLATWRNWMLNAADRYGTNGTRTTTGNRNFVYRNPDPAVYGDDWSTLR